MCTACGWWKAASIYLDADVTEEAYSRVLEDPPDPDDKLSLSSIRSRKGTLIDNSDITEARGIRYTFGAIGSLREFDLADVEAPIREVRSYLTARYHSRFTVHPRLFEETVASVFKSLGFEVLVTGYGNDGGIDVILSCPGGTAVGVQVKRTKNAIKVEQIRSLAGALLVAGITTGVFVTTSCFQRGCCATASLAAIRGKPIHLIDARRFYQALKIAQRSEGWSFDDCTAPFVMAEQQLLRVSLWTTGL
ncbi:restriction endonuclease [Candidatus Fermentibacteria bacterium]|nr:restriction endonuclease [Candidatus Fermentibacteria bacterium]